ncbi:MAG: class II aldolase/adducin family protein [Candidatus Eremiobacteraeota bacterium]|nr:class II aldolase/adducin family protein [Candidatus Eremiobacteraeota bacterium]
MIETGRDLTADLVIANRVLFRHGIIDAFGHVSARSGADPERFLLARNMAPALVEPEDVMPFALDGAPLDGDTRTPYLERFIHGSIYRARPDVGAVVHSHAASLIPFGVVRGVTLRPVFHMSSFLRGKVPVFEIRDAAGPDNDMLVRDEALGDALATELGNEPAVLMRGHGATIVGGDVREAVFRAIFTAQNAALQAEAMRLGEVTFLSDTESLRSSQSNAGQIERAWSLWSRETG